MKISDIKLFSITKDGTCYDGVKMLVTTVGYPSFTLTPTTSPRITPDIPIIYEAYILRQSVTFNDIDTLVNQHIILY